MDFFSMHSLLTYHMARNPQGHVAANEFGITDWCYVRYLGAEIIGIYLKNVLLYHDDMMLEVLLIMLE